MVQRRVLVGNTVVAEYEGEHIVVKMRVENHMRTYVFSEGRMTVTVRGTTEEIALPWKACAGVAA